MSGKPSDLKVKYILSHPIQYFVPLIKKLALCDGIDLRVAYATDAGAREYFDDKFKRKIQWDRPLLQGYDFTVLNPGKDFRKGPYPLSVPVAGVRKFLNSDETDVVILHGWATLFQLWATLAAYAKNVPIIYRTTVGQNINRNPLVQTIKPFVLYPLLRRIDGFLAIGTFNRNYYLGAGVDEKKIFWAPYSVDTPMFLGDNVTDADRAVEMEKIGLKPETFKVLFCGKLFEIKRPFDVIEAVAMMPSSRNVEIIFVGDGKLMPALKTYAEKKGVTAHFAGFRNQQELPVIYSIADVLLLPSELETWGLVVNEAMTSGLPAIVSDKVGCGPDLVADGENGYICPVGDVKAIANALEKMAESQELRKRLRQGAIERIERFSIDRTLEGYLEAITTVAGRR